MKSDPADKPQLDLPVLDQVVDPDSDRARLIGALDELANLIDRVPKGGRGISDVQRDELRDVIVKQLGKRIDTFSTDLKRSLPALVERTIAEYLDQKNEK